MCKRVERICQVDPEGWYAPVIGQELVRCRDCKHCYVDGENVRFNVCELNHNKVLGADWFCADAERKETE